MTTSCLSPLRPVPPTFHCIGLAKPQPEVNPSPFFSSHTLWAGEKSPGLMVCVLSRGLRRPPSLPSPEAMSPALHSGSYSHPPPSSLSDDFTSDFRENKCFQRRSPSTCSHECAHVSAGAVVFFLSCYNGGSSSAYEQVPPPALREHLPSDGPIKCSLFLVFQPPALLIPSHLH